MKDFIYYRCGGSDGYRFGGERICSNSQVQAGFLETAVWREVCNLLMNPEKIELEHEERSKAGALLDNLHTLRSQRTKLQHAMERLIDSFTEGLIEKDQFVSRMDRTKRRIAEYKAVLTRLGARPQVVGRIVNLLREEAEEIRVPRIVEISPDPGDDPVCACAEHGRADFIAALKQERLSSAPTLGKSNYTRPTTSHPPQSQETLTN